MQKKKKEQQAMMKANVKKKIWSLAQNDMQNY